MRSSSKGGAFIGRRRHFPCLLERASLAAPRLRSRAQSREHVHPLVSTARTCLKTFRLGGQKSHWLVSAADLADLIYPNPARLANSRSAAPGRAARPYRTLSTRLVRVPRWSPRRTRSAELLIEISGSFLVRRDRMSRPPFFPKQASTRDVQPVSDGLQLPQSGRSTTVTSNGICAVSYA
jgi:hypothetical protein